MLTVFSLLGKSGSLSWHDNDPGTWLVSKIYKGLLCQPSPALRTRSQSPLLYPADNSFNLSYGECIAITIQIYLPVVSPG